MSQALIFDCDGVVVDVEIQRHLRAFNQMWREQGIAWQWSESEYARALSVSGGRERLDRLRCDPSFREAFDVPKDLEVWRRTIASWHRRKTQIYAELVGAGEVVARRGVRRLAEEALRAGWQVAVATAGARESVVAVVSAALGEDLASEFTLVTGESVRHKKPSPQVFDATAATLGVAPHDCVAIEDSRNGLLAATASGMTCVVTPTRLSFHDDFTEAALVLTGLGEPGGPPEVVLGGRVWTEARPYLRLRDLDDLRLATQASEPELAMAPT